MYAFETNNEILKKWAKRAELLNNGEISPDGVYYKGELYDFYEGRSDFSQLWRKPGNEDELWINSKRRILFVSKDPEESDNPYDRRGPDLFRNPNGSISIGCKFNKNLTRIAAGLTKVNKDWFPTFDEVNNVEYVEECWKNSAIARINLKKHGGGNHCPTQTLKSAILNYKDLILEQLSLLSPNIIVCCGGSGVIKNFIIEEYLKENPSDIKSTDDNWIYFSQNKKTWVIDSYHMSYWGITEKELYEKILANFQNNLRRINTELR